MNKQVLLRFNGDLIQGLQVTLEIWSGGNRCFEMVGRLPPNSELVTCLQNHWNTQYRRIEAPYRINPEAIIYDGNIGIRLDNCQYSAKQLVDQFLRWLDVAEFRPIERRLRDEINREDTLRVLIQTDDQQLQKLPWHLWDWVESRQAEITFCAPGFKPIKVAPSTTKKKVRILAILGHSAGIQVSRDRQLLESLPDAEVTFLVEPNRQVVSDRLWEQPWDILFFAGHSETEQDTGKIYLNPRDNLTIQELKYGLKQSVHQGLKLAIFNSCDGLGLAWQLSDLQIPQMIVMRELIPDRVAQEFLKYFLTAFSGGKSFELSVREARERLQGLEDKFPCASWLPVIFQNPTFQDLTEPPPTWQQLRQPMRPKTISKWPQWQSLLIASLVITSLVTGIRWFGLLEYLELKTFDQLVRLRPQESLDPRLLIVTITEADIEAQSPRDGQGSLSEQTLKQLLEKLNQHQPRVIGLDIYRPFLLQAGAQNSLEPSAHSKSLYQNLIAVCEMGGGENNPTIAPPREMPLEQVGFSDVPIDSDGIVRRQFFGMNPVDGCDTDKSFSFQIVQHYLTSEGVKFNQTLPNSFQIGTVNFKKIEPQTGSYQKLDAAGYQVLLNYRSAQAPAQTVTLGEILNNQFDSSWVKDRIILIGTNARSIEDGLLTPYSAAYAPIQHISGVFVQAQMVSQILSAVQDDRPLIWVLPLWGEVLLIFTSAVLGEAISRFYFYRKLPLIFYFFTGGIILTILGGTSFVILWINGGWIPIIPMGISFILAGVKR
ncbi:MAG: CHASE2 domain-containing protein [Microcoleaceae cyanobacterium]